MLQRHGIESRGVIRVWVAIAMAIGLGSSALIAGDTTSTTPASPSSQPAASVPSIAVPLSDARIEFVGEWVTPTMMAGSRLEITLKPEGGYLVSLYSFSCTNTVAGSSPATFNDNVLRLSTPLRDWRDDELSRLFAVRVAGVPMLMPESCVGRVVSALAAPHRLTPFEVAESGPLFVHPEYSAAENGKRWAKIFEDAAARRNADPSAVAADDDYGPLAEWRDAKIDVAGEWSKQFGDSSLLTLTTKSGGEFAVKFSSVGCLGHESYDRTARCNLGVVTLDAAVREYLGEPFRELFAVRVDGREMLVSESCRREFTNAMRKAKDSNERKRESSYYAYWRRCERDAYFPMYDP